VEDALRNRLVGPLAQLDLARAYSQQGNITAAAENPGGNRIV
jgi:hypothetical protein